MVRRKHIRTLIDDLLDEHSILSAPINVQTITKSMGIAVMPSSTDDSLSGFLYANSGLGFPVIGVNSKHPKYRQNFTIAHELGHYLLHELEDIHVDRQFKVYLRSEQSSRDNSDQEKEANFFAAELLMPERFLEVDIQQIVELDMFKYDTISQLSTKYGVSTQAMTFRLSYLGYIDI